MIDRPLGTLLSLLLLTLGVGLIDLLLHFNRHMEQQMENNIRGIDMVVGAKGSPLQLILSSVYHIDNPTGNISLDEAKKLLKHPLVDFGIPLSFGDTYQGYRIVGTDYSYTDLFNASLSEGKLWFGTLEVTVGAVAAQKLGVNIGDTFSGSHGLGKDGEDHEDHSYKVVGIFKPTNTVIDQLILTATESVWSVHEEERNEEESISSGKHLHENEHSLEEKSEHQITAMLVKFKSPMGVVQLPRIVNEGTNMQAAVPVYEIQRLFTLMGVGIDTIQAVAIVIIVVSGLSIFIGLYGALRDRQYEMALMRTYGATRWNLAQLMLQEGVLITFIGFILGILFSRVGIFTIASVLESDYLYTFTSWTWLAEEWWLLIGTLTLGLLASLLPALQVFTINVSKKLAHA